MINPIGVGGATPIVVSPNIFDSPENTPFGDRTGY